MVLTYSTRWLEKMLYWIGQHIPGNRYTWPTQAADWLWQRRMGWLDARGLLGDEG